LGWVSTWLATQSWKVVVLLERLGQTSIAARIPTWIPHSFVLAAFVLSALAGLVLVVRIWREPAEAAPEGRSP
jgi:hypothetical protein